MVENTLPSQAIGKSLELSFRHKFGQLKAREPRWVRAVFPRMRHQRQTSTEISTPFINVNLHYKNMHLYTLHEDEVFQYCTNATRAVLWYGVSCGLHNRSRLSKENKEELVYSISRHSFKGSSSVARTILEPIGEKSVCLWLLILNLCSK